MVSINTYDNVLSNELYKFLKMLYLFNNNIENIPPWTYLNISKQEFIILYFQDVRQEYNDRYLGLRHKILRRSNSF